MESECLRKYFDELVQSLAHDELLSLVVPQLYSRGFVKAELKNEVFDSNETDGPQLTRAARVMNEVELYIKTNPKELSGLLEILRAHNLSKSVAEKIHQEILYGSQVPPLTSHDTLRLLQDCHFNITAHWHQLGGDLGVSLDERRKLQELAIRTQNYDGALEECLDTWIRNTVDPSWEGLVQAVERYEISTADRMRELLKFPKLHRSRSRGLPRQGSSYDSVGDPWENSGVTVAPVSAIPLRSTPSPSTAASTITTSQQDHSPSKNNCSSVNTTSGTCFSNPLSNTSHENVTKLTISFDSSPLMLNKSASTPSKSDPPTINTTGGRHASASEEAKMDMSPTDYSSKFQMECELINGSTKQVIKTCQMSQPGIASPVYRDVKIKKVAKYSTVPPLTPLIVRVTANQRCYLYIINIGSSGRLSTLIPNESDKNNVASPGETIQFPPIDADYEFELDEQSGTEIIIVMSYASERSVEAAETDCCQMREKSVYREVKIKKKQVIPLGMVEMQFSVNNK